MPAARVAGGGHRRLQPPSGHPYSVTVPDAVVRDLASAVASLGIVPVEVGVPGAPLGCGAFRALRGRPLLHWAVTALTASGVVRRVLVVVPPELEAAAQTVLADVAGVPDLLAVPAAGPREQVLAALRAGHERADDLVVVHDPLYALSPPAVVRAVVGVLAGAPEVVAAVPVRPVTDTLKWVDDDEIVRDTADRERYRLTVSPQAYRSAALLDALHAALAVEGDAVRARGEQALVGVVAARGGRLVLVPAPPEVFRVGTEDDLVLADALLSLDATEVTGAGAMPAGAPREAGRAGRSP
jgi:2-C-methyl-D-erythritol 4-phosphate cytidylyltransferase/2-C-methyl-D-erythritol 2,4-cyclodiphosphate synthase